MVSFALKKISTVHRPRQRGLFIVFKKDVMADLRGRTAGHLPRTPFYKYNGKRQQQALKIPNQVWDDVLFNNGKQDVAYATLSDSA